MPVGSGQLLPEQEPRDRPLPGGGGGRSQGWECDPQYLCNSAMWDALRQAHAALHVTFVLSFPNQQPSESPPQDAKGSHYYFLSNRPGTYVGMECPTCFNGQYNPALCFLCAWDRESPMLRKSPGGRRHGTVG